ncbi:MAG TPA: CoA transferase, partial [Pseudomonadales bacterium]|nr:CoA transferase [Pseudomonadales bacterium]
MSWGSVSALNGLRVLELCGPEGAYCGRLLADLGAEVMRLEPRGGDALRGLPPYPPGTRSDGYIERYVNAGKTSVTLDPETHAGRELLLELVRSADLLIET